MRHIKFCASMALLCFLTLNCMAQSKPLKIGDIIPDVELGRVINHKKESLKISDFKGKLLIIDFWATWCAPCVAFLGKADSLQKQFGGQIEILPVTKESEKVVKPFLDKLKGVRGFLPPSVIESDILEPMFPHTYIPHEVWIDGKGKVIAITGYEEVNSVNISKALRNELGSLSVKVDEQPNSTSSVNNTVIVLDKENKEDIILSCYFGKYQEGKGGGGSRDRKSNSLEFKNQPIFGLCQYAFGKFSPDFGELRMIVESKNNHITYPNGTQEEKIAWWKENGYCYRISANKDIPEDELFIKMQDDINCFIKRKFGLECVMEKRKVSYWALIRTSREDKLATRFPSAQEEVGYDKRFSMSMKNAPYWRFFMPLQTYNLQLERVVDETGFDKRAKIDISLDCELSKIEDLNKALAKYDIQFVKKEGMLDMVIIRDLKKTSR